MAMTPAASPSRPSIRLTALAMPITQSAVTSGRIEGESTMKPAKGTLKCDIVTPRKYRTMAASTWPATLAGADTSRRSSTKPTTKMTNAPSTTPSGSDDPWKDGAKTGSAAATPMAASRPTSMPTPPKVGVGTVWTRSASGMTTKRRRTATWRTTKVQRNVTTAAAPKTTRQPTSWVTAPPLGCGPPSPAAESAPGPLGFGVRVERPAQLAHLGPDGDELGLVVPVAQRPGEEAGHHGHLGLAHAGGRLGGGAEAQPARHEGRARVVGDLVAVARDAGPVEGLLGHLAGQLGVEVAEVDEDEVVLGPARGEPEALGDERLGEGLGVRHDLGGVLLEGRLHGLLEGDSLGGDHVVERAALQAREDRRVDRAGEVGPAEDGPAPRAAERLVGRERHDVGHPDRGRVHPAGDEAGRVGDVEHELGADLVGDLPEGLGVDDARVGGGAGDDELRALALGDVADLVEVDALTRAVRAGRGDAVGHETVELPGDRHRRPVGEVAPLVEAHGADRVARLDEGEISGEVGDGAGVRLDVGVLGAEELLRPLAGEVLDLVRHHVPAVVAPARVALGVLVGENRRGRLEDGPGGEVLRGDELERGALPLELLGEEAADVVVLRQCPAQQSFEPCDGRAHHTCSRLGVPTESTGAPSKSPGKRQRGAQHPRPARQVLHDPHPHETRRLRPPDRLSRLRRRQLGHERTARAEPGRGACDDRLERLEAGRARDERLARVVVA